MSADKRRIVVLGSRSVGKSPLIMQYCQNEFVQSYYPTIESTFGKTIHFNNHQYDCSIIDTAGQDEFSIFNAKHAIGIHGYVLVLCLCSFSSGFPDSALRVYSITSQNSFDMIRIIHAKIIDFCGVPNVPCVIVGSKVDLEKSRQVNSEEMEEAAKLYDATWVETSAMCNINVSKVFDLCLSEIEKQALEAEPPLNRCFIV
ncbi:P-loop containing nucleoside triphosphate hydrolase protein [Mycena olivaceomarginata]|nr:P-loop containing nucleoside triphosphate hydrolase protein [Mycena olivaceomarginata]